MGRGCGAIARRSERVTKRRVCEWHRSALTPVTRRVRVHDGQVELARAGIRHIGDHHRADVVISVPPGGVLVVDIELGVARLDLAGDNAAEDNTEPGIQ